MPTQTKTTKTTKPAKANKAATVDGFLSALDDPRKPLMERLRRLILSVDPSISEGIKWNAPSFKTTDDFATFNLRGKKGLLLILHTGAKTKESAKRGMDIPDPDGLLEWPSKDRAIVTFTDEADLSAKTSALEAILRAWLKYLG